MKARTTNRSRSGAALVVLPIRSASLASATRPTLPCSSVRPFSFRARVDEGHTSQRLDLLVCQAVAQTLRLSMRCAA
jgi:hypothetical protein